MEVVPSGIKRRKLIARIHVLKRELGWDDDRYRACLSGLTGVGSCADIEREADLLRVVEVMAAEAGQRAWSGRRCRPVTGRVSERQMWKLCAQWRRLYFLRAVTAGDRAALEVWIRRQYGVERLEWLTLGQGAKAIDALKSWIARVGGD